MAKEDCDALAISLRGEDSQASARQGDVQDHAAEAGASAGVEPLGDEAPSASSSDSEHPASENSEGYLPAPHLVSVYEEDAKLQLSKVGVRAHAHTIVMHAIFLDNKGQPSRPGWSQRRRLRRRLGGLQLGRPVCVCARRGRGLS